MAKIFLGVLVGFSLGIVGSAIATEIVGSNGYLLRWNVIANGRVICSDPFVWAQTREIECN